MNVPEGVSPTDPSLRGWLVSPVPEGYPVWIMFAASVPALLVFVLIFMESHITEMLISKKERCLKKGTGYHLNLVTLGILNGLLPIFGMPWVVCSTLKSLIHADSLTVMSTSQAPGQSPKIDGMREQRLTTTFSNLLLACSIFMAPLLKEIPIAVLFGVFLYMGVKTLSGVEFVDRIQLMFMPAKNYPDYNYVKTVRPKKIVLYTVVQILCLAVLWVVKSNHTTKIAFPFFLILCVPVRMFIMPLFYSRKELDELDSK